MPISICGKGAPDNCCSCCCCSRCRPRTSGSTRCSCWWGAGCIAPTRRRANKIFYQHGSCHKTCTLHGCGFLCWLNAASGHGRNQNKCTAAVTLAAAESGICVGATANGEHGLCCAKGLAPACSLAGNAVGQFNGFGKCGNVNKPYLVRRLPHGRN